jgi:hypothetical protein
MIISPARSPVPRVIGKRVGFVDLAFLDFHTGGFCGLRIYLLALGFVGLIPVESNFRGFAATTRRRARVTLLFFLPWASFAFLVRRGSERTPDPLHATRLIQHANQLLFAVEQVESHECHRLEV